MKKKQDGIINILVIGFNIQFILILMVDHFHLHSFFIDSLVALLNFIFVIFLHKKGKK